MTSIDDLEDRLDALESRFGVGETAVVIAGYDRGENADWPDDVAREDIITTRQEEGADPEIPLEVEERVVPHHRPPEFRGGIVLMSDPEIAWVFATMPEDVRRAERELRIERGEPIPPVLQQ